jgi:Heparinase II/III-like protein/Heparinase II/III N-terminus
MSITTMSNPLETLRKLKGRSLKELRTRSEQAITAYSEQMGFGGKVPHDEEFFEMVNRDAVGGRVSAESLLKSFQATSEGSFFPAFANRKETAAEFRERFGDRASRFLIEKADMSTAGKFDLLGYLNLDFGRKPAWHLEPIAGKRSPLKHWKQFDELDAEETGDKKIVWELNRHQHFFALGAAYWLTGEERYADTFVAHLEGWMDQNPPQTGVNWFSSLEIALRGISWIWAFNFFKNSRAFSPEIFLQATKFLYLHGRHIEKYLSMYYSPNTHLTGEALGLYYLGTQLPFLDRAEHWRKLGEDILIGELDRQILADGVYFEQSTWYARYTADFFLHFAILNRLGGSGDNARADEKLSIKVQSLLDFLMYVTRPDGTTPLIGDDDGGRMLPLSSVAPDDFRGSLAVGAAVFKRGDYKFIAGGGFEEALWLLGADGLNLLDAVPAVEPEKTSKSFAVGGYFVMRDGWTEDDNYLLVDCGELGALNAGHGHADTLAVDVAAGGKTLLVDIGTYSYHESNEVRDCFRTSAAHNSLTIDNQSSSLPGGKFSWQTVAQPEVKSWITQDRFDFFGGSHEGYKASKSAIHDRSILFLKNDYWIIRDYVETLGEHAYELNFHFDQRTEAQVSEAGVSVSTGEHVITIGDNGSWNKEEGWVSTCYGERHNAPLLRYATKGSGPQEFFTFLFPASPFSEPPAVLETEIAGGRAFVVNFRDYRDVFVFSDGGEIIRTEFFDSDFRFLWARLGQGDEVPEEFVMVNGSYFFAEGREVINHSGNLKFAAARRLGNRLNVRTNDNVFSLSLPQTKPHTLILKSEAQSGDL